MGLYSIGPDEKGAIAIDPYPGMTILGYFTRPESQGEIRLASADPDARPIINANPFSAEIDRISVVSLFKWLSALGKQDALKEWIVEETLHGSRLEPGEDITDHGVQVGDRG